MQDTPEPVGSSDHVGFAPYDTTDARRPGDWRSKYTDPEARHGILTEAIYVAIMLGSVPLLMFVLWMEWPKAWFALSDPKFAYLQRYGFAWLAGTLGGTLFDIKWLYHAIAKREWHLDRRLWRLFTPHVSGALSFAVIALVSSGLVQIFDKSATNSIAAVIGLSFLTGYFSDSAIAKLSQVAETLFGETRAKEKGEATKPPPNITPVTSGPSGPGAP